MNGGLDLNGFYREIVLSLVKTVSTWELGSDWILMDFAAKLF